MQKRTGLSKHFARAFGAQVSAWKWSASALAIAVAGSAYAPSVMAQETSGQMNGFVFDASGAPAAGIPVTVKHLPSGTTVNVSTNAQGRFIARGLRLGGPYEVTFTPPGGTPRKVEQEVFVSLGQAYELDIPLAGREAIQEIVVSGQQRQLAELKTGPSTTFDLSQIQNAPKGGRDFKDILRADPKVYIDRFNSDAIQIAGASNRYNLLTVDGVRQNDDFGLNNGGYPTLRAPLSLDVIEQLSVNTAPYAVTYSGFQGGNINIVTKSGGNKFTGSAFYSYSDDSLLGDKSGNRDILGFDFKDKAYGGTFGGPIVQDKLFFFAGYEKFTTSSPVTRGPAGSPFANQVAQITQADYDQIRSIAQSVYGYNIGTLDGSAPESDEKIFGKINWNVIEGQQLVVSYNRNKGSQVIQNTPIAFTPAGTAAPIASLASASNWYNQIQVLDSVSAQLFSDWSDVFKTEIKYGWKQQKNSPTPIGAVPWAEVQVRTPGGGNLSLGPDRSRHFNALDIKTQTIKVKGDYLLGNHTITAGYEREMVDVFNAFLQDRYGVFYFNSIADFQARRATALTFQNAVSGNIDDAAAQFKSNIDSFYVQDSWEVTPDLTVVGGLRYERYSSGDKPIANARFLARYGFSNTETYDGRDLVLPRFAFNYKFSDKTIVRGGVGLFGGGNPNVWLSNSYSNTGIAASNTTVLRTSTVPGLAAVLDNVNPANIPAIVQQQLVAGDGSVNAIDPNFKIPSVWKASLAIDQSFDLGALGDNYFFTAELIYSKAKNPVLWVENRVVQSGTAPDGRPLYVRRAGVPTGGNDLVMTNGKGGRGWVASLQGSKQFETSWGDLDFQLGYAWQDITEKNPGTSSTAQSNWDNVATANINDPAVSTSTYESKHNITMGAQWSKAFIDDYKTTVSLFGFSRSGRPFSYTFSGNSAIFGDPRQAARQRQLFYVPRDANDVILRNGLTWEALDAYITAKGLDKYRGQIAPRNAFRSPWSTQFDLRVAQEIPAFFPEGAKGVFSMDIRNVGNLINSKWGRLSQVNFGEPGPNVVPIVQATGIEGGKYVYSGPIAVPAKSIQARQSVWAILFSVRYEF
jgi:hypothetical protein